MESGKKTKDPPWKVIVPIVVAFVLGPVLLRVFVVEAYKIPAGSMQPTYDIGDHFFVNKFAYLIREPARGEVAVFEYPLDRNKDYVKRIVAVGGDLVEFDKGEIWINGAPIERTAAGEVERADGESGERLRYHVSREKIGEHTYSVWNDARAPVGERPDPEPVRVPDGHFYVLGDNRDNSSDSRLWGLVPSDAMKGPAMFVWWSR